jgi:hypothetical protein
LISRTKPSGNSPDGTIPFGLFYLLFFWQPARAVSSDPRDGAGIVRGIPPVKNTFYRGGIKRKSRSLLLLNYLHIPVQFHGRISDCSATAATRENPREDREVAFALIEAIAVYPTRTGSGGIPVKKMQLPKTAANLFSRSFRDSLCASFAKTVHVPSLVIIKNLSRRSRITDSKENTKKIPALADVTK